MTVPPGKIPILLTAVQVDLIGEALVEQISCLADRLSKAARTGTTLEELSLLKAYLEIATVMMDQKGIDGDRAGTNGSALSTAQHLAGEASALQNRAMKLRQP